MSQRHKGYMLPETVEPEGFYCVPVYVPRDTLYLQNFLGALDFFGKWLAWDDGGDGRAKLAADLWKIANQLTREAYAEGECGMAFQLRQNPDNACQLQQSSDGGATWSLAFDYSLCQQVITVPAPYPDSETGNDDAAAAVIRNLFEELVNMVDCATMTRQQYIDAATAYIRAYDAGFAQPVALGALYDAACEMTEEELEVYTDDCTYTGKFEELSECANVQGVWDWLDCLNELLTNWLDDTNDDLMNALNQVARAITGDGFQLLASGSAGGGAGFGAACGCDGLVIDFTTGTHGTYAITGGLGVTAQYVNNPGFYVWANVFFSGSPGSNELRIQRDFGANYHITTFKVHFVEVPAGLNTYFNLNPVSFTNEGGGWWSYSPNADMAQIRIDFQINGSEAVAIWIDKWCVEYTGDPPPFT